MEVNIFDIEGEARLKLKSTDLQNHERNQQQVIQDQMDEVSTAPEAQTWTQLQVLTMLSKIAGEQGYTVTKTIDD
jgi:hypothetical protein